MPKMGDLVGKLPSYCYSRAHNFCGKQTKYLEEKEGGLVSLIWKNQAHDSNPIVESIRTYGRPPRFL